MLTSIVLCLPWEIPWSCGTTTFNETWCQEELVDVSIVLLSFSVKRHTGNCIINSKQWQIRSIPEDLKEYRSVHSYYVLPEGLKPCPVLCLVYRIWLCPSSVMASLNLSSGTSMSTESVGSESWKHLPIQHSITRDWPQYWCNTGCSLDTVQNLQSITVSRPYTDMYCYTYVIRISSLNIWKITPVAYYISFQQQEGSCLV
jgi:hypothetical protein